jgi:hypothetical protein
VFDYVDAGRTVREYLAEALGALKDVVAYSPDEGLTFPLASSRRRFDQAVGLAEPPASDAYSLLRAAAGSAGTSTPESPPLPTQPLAAIRGLLATEPRRRPPGAVERLVERLGAESRVALLELERAPRRNGREAGLPDDLPALQALVRRARSTPADLFDAVALREADVARDGRGPRRSL